MVDLNRWLKHVAINDPVEREQAYLLQIMMIGMGCIALFSLPFGILVAATPTEALSNAFNIGLTVLTIVGAIWTLRRGRFRRAILMISSVLLAEYAITLWTEGIRTSGWLLFGFVMPMTLTGLLAGRRAIIFITALSIGIVTTIGLLELTTSGLIGQFPRQGDTLPVSIIAFNLWAMIVALFFYRFSATLRHALSQALAREEELTQIRDQLEIRVRERTTALEDALQIVRDRETHLAHTNRELEEAKTAAEMANALKTTFLANMSHELRTPLNAIINYSHFLQHPVESDDAETQSLYLTRVSANAEHLLGLINDILDLSKIEAGHVTLIREPTDLSVLLQSVHATALGLTKDKPIHVLLDLDPSLPLLHIDKTRIRQVFLNLLSNAAKFTEAGTITIQAQRPNADHVEIVVTDTGIGIAPEHHARVFEEFQQVEDELTRAYEGTGLGLAITKRLVELHGGEIRLSSAVGVGSTFTVILPVEAPPVELPLESAMVPLQDTRPVIMLVDDDPDAQRVVQRILEPAGYQVQSVGDSRQVIPLLLAQTPDLIILDVLMPHIDGWSLVAQIRAEPSLVALPVLICSIADPAQQTTWGTLGIADYLVKPVSSERMLQAVERWRPASTAIAVIDDDPDVRRTTRVSLERAKIRVYEADSGAAGLEIIRQYRPGVILLDLMMPEMDGFMVIDQLRSDPTLAMIPVIVVTAKDLTAEERQWLQERTVACVQKAVVTTEGLRSLVDTFIQKKG